MMEKGDFLFSSSLAVGRGSSETSAFSRSTPSLRSQATTDIGRLNKAVVEYHSRERGVNQILTVFIK
ncbi:MAG: hypothetical protein LBL99_04365 [Holosporaceae bacterium]|nr:hypothetical protein [Holosporaceae bacterium]